MKKKLLGILNKITPEKFRILLEQIFNLIQEPYIEMERLKTAIDVIFDKVLFDFFFVIFLATQRNLSEEFSLLNYSIQEFSLDIHVPLFISHRFTSS